MNVHVLARRLDLGALSEFPVQGARVVDVFGVKVAVFRTRKDAVFAVENRCPHRGGPLSEGIVHGMKVTCPLHDQVFNLDSGHALPPDEGCVLTFPAAVENGRVMLDASRLTPEPA